MADEVLWRPGLTPDVPPDQAVAVVHAFLVRCRGWALTREIPKRTLRVQQDPTPEAVASLHSWVSYLRFTEHAIQEIETGTLDHWFRRPDNT
jgi:hypothetical protein